MTGHNIYSYYVVFFEQTLQTLVAIPTYNNCQSGYSIRATLEGLTKQSHKNFSTLIVYKPSPNDHTKDIVDGFRDKIEIELATQEVGHFDEAMNIVFKTSMDYDYLLTLDDDSVPCDEWLAQHLSLQATLQKVSVIGGKLNPSHISLPPHHNYLMRRLRSIIGFEKPLFDQFRGYVVFVNDIGLLVHMNPEFYHLLSYGQVDWDTFLEQFDFLLSVGFSGANASYKTRYLQGFQLPQATVRGIGNERALAVHLLNQGTKVVVVNSCTVSHTERESLSRSTSSLTSYHIALEDHIQPYLVNHFKKIDYARLERYLSMVRMYSRIHHSVVSKAYLAGLTIARKAIAEDWAPERVRQSIKNQLEEYSKRPQA